MLGAEFGGEPRDELGAFELVDPFLDGLGEFIARDAGAGELATGAELPGGFGPHAGEDIVAIKAKVIEFFIHEDHGGDAVSAADLDLIGEIDGFVTIDDAEVDFAVGSEGDVLHDGDLLGAVAAPGATDDQYGLAAGESAEEGLLCGGQSDFGVIGGPVGLLIG